MIMTLATNYKFTVHSSTSFSTTRTSFPKNGTLLSCRLSHSRLRHFLDDFGECRFSGLFLGFLFTHSLVGRLHKQTTILMRETPQISIVPTNDGDRCSILLTIAERLAINSPSTYSSDSPSKHKVSKIDHSCALVLRHYLS